MNKRDLAVRLAREAGLPRAAAADRLDQVVRDILDRLRKQGAATLPGIGTLHRDRNGDVRFEPEAQR